MMRLETPLPVPPGGPPPRPPVTYGDHFVRLMDMRERSVRLLVAIERELQVMIDRLDEEDGDPDLEPYLAGGLGVPTDDREDEADDEPMLGSPEQHPAAGGRRGDARDRYHGIPRSKGNQAHWALGDGDSGEELVDEDGNDEQREGECADGTVDDELTGDEQEPWLGALEHQRDQTNWGHSGASDGEAVNEDGEDYLCFPYLSPEARAEKERRVREVADQLRKRRGKHNPHDVCTLVLIGPGLGRLQRSPLL